MSNRELLNSSTLSSMTAGTAVHFEGGIGQPEQGRRGVSFQQQDESTRSLMSAPPAPPHEHRRGSIKHDTLLQSIDDSGLDDPDAPPPRRGGRAHRYTLTFGGVSKRSAIREIRRARKTEIIDRRGWSSSYNPQSTWTLDTDGTGVRTLSIEERPGEEEASEGTSLIPKSVTSSGGGGGSHRHTTSSLTVPIGEDGEDTPWEALKEMFLENKINVLFVFLPLAYWSHAAKWNDGSIFILNFLAMVPLASMLGIFTEELAAHTNDVIGGLINATFGNAVELVVAIQALLKNDFRVVQASLIGSVFSNLLLVLGMCFFCGGIVYSEQEFIAQGAVASIALLGFNGLTLLIPEVIGDESAAEGDGMENELNISRLGAILMILMYAQLLFFQMKTHVHLFEGDGEEVALIPFRWALIGLVLITAVVTILSDWLVGSIDGFCEEFNLGRSFVGVIILPVVGNAVEHISAVSVAMKNKMDLALGGETSFGIVLKQITSSVCFVTNKCSSQSSQQQLHWDLLFRSPYLFYLWLL